MQLPSATNTYGSLAGLVSGFIVTKLVSAGVIASIAVFVGMPPLWVTGAIGVVAASVVNYGVTHFAEVKQLDALVSVLPKTYQQYPGDNSASVASTNLNLKS